MRRLIVSGFAGLLAIGAAVAADPPVPTVAGSGTAEIKRTADRLRVQVEVMARGKNLEEALQKLAARKAECTAAFEKIGAIKGSVTFAETDMVDDQGDRQSAMERMMSKRNRALGKPVKPKTETPTVVAAMAKTDFPLPANQPDALLLASKSIQEKVKAAELGGLKTDEKASPEAEEQAEEAIGSPDHRGGGDAPRGTPTFLFVATIAEADKAKAMAEAFAAARKDAARLAAAAGQSLGDLQRLADASQPSGDPEEMMMMYGQSIRYGGMRRMDAAVVGNEAIGMSGSKLTVKFGVAAHFRLVPAK